MGFKKVLAEDLARLKLAPAMVGPRTFLRPFEEVNDPF